jgi:RimJ/RimL family protein N-acetyltransferase
VRFGIKSDHWGQGYATEFLEGFLDIWRRLPREVVVTRVPVGTVYGDREIKDECLAGIPTYDNVACHRVLEKSGFEKRVDWEVSNYRREKKERLFGWVMTKSNAQLLEEQLSALRIT